MLPIWGVSGLCFSHCEADSFLLYVADLARVSSETMGQAPSTRVLKWPTEDLSEPAYIPLADASDDTINNQRLVQLLAEEKALESQYRAVKDHQRSVTLGSCMVWSIGNFQQLSPHERVLQFWQS